MSGNSNNIEERLIPYIEGVLNEREQREVAEAIKADAALAREVQDLREVISDLREAFASGVEPKSEPLTVEEVVEMASHQGGLETLPGGSDKKSRLFCNDQSFEEYQMLRSLSEEMQQTTLPIAEVPPMPASMLSEIARYKSTPQKPKIVELAPKLNSVKPLKGGVFGFLDRFDPKPLMAAAAALALVSLGIHSYSNSADNASPTVGGRDVAYKYSQPSGTPTAPAVTEVADGTNSEPSGVTVFTSSDRSLLKEQAEKLLAKKVRYTVTEDRILVSEKELAQARAVLWGDEESAAIAAADEKTAQESLGSTTPTLEDKGISAPRVPFPQDRYEEELEEPAPPPITFYPPRGTRSGAGDQIEIADEGSVKQPSAAPTPALVKPTASSSSSNEPSWSASGGGTEKPDQGVLATGSSRSDSAPSKLKEESDDQRRERLKDLALGKTPAAGGANYSRSTTITRASRAPEPQAEKRPAPVPNVITSDKLPGRSSAGDENYSAMEDPSGPVAAKQRAQGVERGPVPQAVTAEPPPAPAVVVPQSVTSEEPEITRSGGDVDLRMANVRSSQAAVARRYNVTLSVDSSANGINVYVRPGKTLSKDEMDDLRRAIRAELGLASEDTIIFR